MTLKVQKYRTEKAFLADFCPVDLHAHHSLARVHAAGATMSFIYGHDENAVPRYVLSSVPGLEFAIHPRGSTSHRCLLVR
jgi:hypothetical protein